MSQRASPRFKGGAGCTTCHVPHFVVSFVYACFGCLVKGGLGGYCLSHRLTRQVWWVEDPAW
jgi:hypothetical protein